MKFLGYIQHISFYKTEAKAVATGSTVLLGRGYKMQSQNHQKRLLRCAGRPAAPSTRHLWGDTRGQSSRYHKHKNESNNTTAERYKVYFKIWCKFLCKRFLEIGPLVSVWRRIRCYFLFESLVASVPVELPKTEDEHGEDI